MAPKRVPFAPWEEVHVELIRPGTVKTTDGKLLKFNALTCVDPVTNLVELVRIENNTSDHVSRKLNNTWLSRYPMLVKCVYDNISEFIGREFREVLEGTDIEKL